MTTYVGKKPGRHRKPEVDLTKYVETLPDIALLPVKGSRDLIAIDRDTVRVITEHGLVAPGSVELDWQRGTGRALIATVNL